MKIDRKKVKQVGGSVLLKVWIYVKAVVSKFSTRHADNNWDKKNILEKDKFHG